MGKDKIEEITLSEERAIESIEEFLEDYLDPEYQVIEAQYDVIEENGLEIVNEEVDFIQFKRFIDTAYVDLIAMDAAIGDGIVRKAYMEVQKIHDSYQKFLEKTKYSKVIFTRDLLENVPEYKKLNKLKEEAQNLVKQYETMAKSAANEMAKMEQLGQNNQKEFVEAYKTLNRKNIDSLHHKANTQEKLVVYARNLKQVEDVLRKHFFELLEEFVQEIQDNFHEILNIKIYYFDVILWKNANKSRLVRAFFKNASIKGDLSTKTFLNYYLKNLDQNKIDHNKWHQYLFKVRNLL